jgi:endogenous inhibitor of DNA gyrase (YacG/DUF329 family)
MATNYVACPKCGKPDPKKVSFTWWGGILGPKLLTHVKCEACGAAFNGKSGKDNTTGIVIYCAVVGLFLFALVVVIVAAVIAFGLRS